MNEHSKSKGCWLINWIDTKKKETNMWMKIFEKFKTYILKKKYKIKRKEE